MSDSLDELIFKRVFHNSPVGIVIANMKGQILEANPAFQRLLGYSMEDLRLKNFSSLTHPEDLQLNIHLFNEFVSGVRHDYQMEKRYIHHDGHAIWARITIFGVVDPQTQQRLTVGMIEDINEIKAIQEQIIHNSLHDPLTRLPNRALFQDRIDLTLAQSRSEPDHEFAILLLDIDRFQMINNTFGHQYGDLLLQQIAHRLRSCVHEGNTVARLGGDEFGILVDHLHDPHQVIDLIEKIRAELAVPFQLDSQEVHTSSSIGIVFSNERYLNASDMLRDGDIALFRAKSEGRNTFAFFDPKMFSQLKQQLDLERDLITAIDQSQFKMYYQPIVCPVTGRVTAGEALIRWDHPEKGMQSPGVFIPYAEESGLILPIGKWVLRTVIDQVEHWKSIGFPVRISINISPKQFIQSDFLQDLKESMPPEADDTPMIAMEITEGLLMEGSQEIREKLDQIAKMGIPIIIDDFGTGYSSLSYLKYFPIHTIKMDRSYVKDIHVDQKGAAIAKTIVYLADQLKVRLIAEGVEIQDELDFLTKQKVMEIQGYYYSRPLPADQFETYVRTMGLRRASRNHVK